MTGWQPASLSGSSPSSSLFQENQSFWMFFSSQDGQWTNLRSEAGLALASSKGLFWRQTSGFVISHKFEGKTIISAVVGRLRTSSRRFRPKKDLPKKNMFHRWGRGGRATGNCGLGMAAHLIPANTERHFPAHGLGVLIGHGTQYTAESGTRTSACNRGSTRSCPTTEPSGWDPFSLLYTWR